MINEMIERYRYMNRNVVQNLQALTCTAEMTKVYNAIKGKKINDAKFQLVPTNYMPSNGSVNWYRGGTSETDNVLAFIDRRDPTYDYGILIFTHGWIFNPNCCNTNPVIDCICSTDIESPCIIMAVQNKSGTTVDIPVPDSVINSAISLLFPSKLGLYIGIVAGIGILGTAVYVLTKKKK